MSEANNIMDELERLLELEEHTDPLTKIPPNIYSRVAVYTQKLRKSVDTNVSDAPSRITKKQLWLIEGMATQLLSRRLNKALSRNDTRDLLPEERYVYESYAEYSVLRQKFVSALSSGQPSFFALLQKQQMKKMITVRFLKPLGEVMGFDLNRYGPFKVHDVAQIPAGNAEALISNGDALEVFTSDSI